MKRRKWCKERLNWSVEEWSRVIFSDESNFQVFNRKSKVMVKRLGSEIGWAWMDRKMLDTKVTSVEHLKEVLVATWESIPRELCMKLIESMPKRVKMCYLAKGGYFRY